MPIQIKEENEGQSIAVQVSGTLVKADYERLVPELERRIREHGKLRLMFEMDDFKGWEPGACWDEVKFDVKHFADIERVAVVGDKRWEQDMTDLYRPFTEASVRYFDVVDSAKAWKWLREPALAAAATAH